VWIESAIDTIPCRVIITIKSKNSAVLCTLLLTDLQGIHNTFFIRYDRIGFLKPGCFNDVARIMLTYGAY
jgi:hypothetical protein